MSLDAMRPPVQALGPLFDALSGARAREAALVEVEIHAPEDWKDRALAAVRACALDHTTFIVDEVWSYLDADDVPHEPRAMGAIMRNAVREGWVIATGAYRPSDRVSTHRSPRGIWQSLIVGAFPTETRR